MQDIHTKATTTLKVLSSNLISGEIPLENILEFYKESKREVIIKLMLRCKKMYEVRALVKKILLLKII